MHASAPALKIDRRAPSPQGGDLNDGIKQLIAQDAPDPVAVMQAVVDWLRPDGTHSDKPVTARMTELRQWLEARPDSHRQLAKILQDWLMEASYFELFTNLGILSRRGFSREFIDRLYERLNPAPRHKLDIRDTLAIIFHHRDDYLWVDNVPTDDWIGFLAFLWDFDSEQLKKVRYKVCSEVLYAIEMLSIWVAAEELEAEIVRLDPKVVNRDSAFVAQQRELAAFIRHYQQWLDGEAEFYDDEHARVLLGQCADAIALLRKRMMVKGTSVALTHLLERLDQTRARIELLLDTLTIRQREGFNDKAVTLLKQLVRACNERNSLSVLWRQNSGMLARSVTENASHQGEHYITDTRRDYFQMLRSGAGGGFIIALMALIKIQILARGFAPFSETLLSSLNYGLGFMLIHMAGCTVATKQPAMTAANFANAVEKEDQGRANAAKLADLLVRVSRSQFIAIIGNVAVALALAYLLTRGYSYWRGAPLIDDLSAHYLLHRLDILGSPALLHAAIAGLWLFVAGLVSGYFDNRAARLDLGARLQSHPLLSRVLPEGPRQRVATYIDDNYGALIGNFTFGVLLGATGYIGYLTGLPLDIRHVAFSSADLGFGSASLALDSGVLVLYGVAVLMIGGVNLWVSFSLALAVALRAREARVASPPKLAQALWRQIRRRPLSLLFPPDQQQEENGQDPPEGGTGRDSSRDPGP